MPLRSENALTGSVGVDWHGVPEYLFIGLKIETAQSLDSDGPFTDVPIKSVSESRSALFGATCRSRRNDFSH